MTGEIVVFYLIILGDGIMSKNNKSCKIEDLEKAIKMVADISSNVNVDVRLGDKKGDNESIEVDSQVRKSKIPHLRTKNGRIEIDKNDPVQVNWSKNFRK